jgi:cobyrinic acid a,c-diamide synthase
LTRRRRLNIPILGAIPRSNPSLAERHLGLVQALEHEDLSSHLDDWPT